MAQTLKFGNKVWAAKEESVLAYNDINNNYKPLPFFFKRTSIGTRVNKDGLIETMGQDIARIDYTDSADGVLLLEPSSTNLITYSEDFVDNYWEKSEISIIADSTTSPDGSLNGYSFTRNASTGSSFIRKQITTATGVVSLSIFAKYNGRQFLQLSSGVNYSNFDLLNGIITVSSSNSGSSIENYGNGWYRLIININLAGTLNYYYIWNIDSANSARVEASTGNGTDGIYIYGAQLEQLSYPTSYIPTSGSSVTRAAETCNNSGNSEVFNDSEGVLFVNTATLQEGVTEKIISLSDGTTSNNIYFSFSGAANTIYGLVVSGGSTQASLSTTVSQIQPNKLLIKYKSNDISFWLNGFKVGFDTSANTPSGLKNLSFSYPTNAINFYGKTKELGYYDTALTDLELETLTSYRNWVSMVNELNLNIIYNG